MYIVGSKICSVECICEEYFQTKRFSIHLDILMPLLLVNNTFIIILQNKTDIKKGIVFACKQLERERIKSNANIQIKIYTWNGISDLVIISISMYYI